MQSRVKITNTHRTINQQVFPPQKNNKETIENFPQVNLHHRLYSFAEADEPTFHYQNTRQIIRDQSSQIEAFCEDFASLYGFVNKCVYLQDGCGKLEVGSLSEILMFNTWDKNAVMEALEEQKSIADITVNKHICDRMEKYLRIFDRLKIDMSSEVQNHSNQISYQQKNQYYTPTNQGDKTVIEYNSTCKDTVTEAVSFMENKRKIPERSPIKKYNHRSEQSPYLVQQVQKRVSNQEQEQKRRIGSINPIEESQTPNKEYLKLEIDLGRKNRESGRLRQQKMSEKRRNSTHSKIFHKIEISGVERMHNRNFQSSEQSSTGKLQKKPQKNTLNSQKNSRKSIHHKQTPPKKQQKTISVVKSSKVDPSTKPTNKNSKYTIGKKPVPQKQKWKQTLPQPKIADSRIRGNSRIVSNRSTSREKSMSSVKESRMKRNIGEKSESKKVPACENRQDIHHHPQRSLTNSRYQNNLRKQQQKQSSRVQSPQKQPTTEHNEPKFRSIAEQTVYKSNYFINMLKIVGDRVPDN